MGIRNKRITIGRRTIRLRRTKNKKFRGWWTFPYRRVTYYIRFTKRGIRVVTLKGKKVVTLRTIRKRPRRKTKQQRKKASQRKIKSRNKEKKKKKKNEDKKKRR